MRISIISTTTQTSKTKKMNDTANGRLVSQIKGTSKGDLNKIILLALFLLLGSNVVYVMNRQLTVLQQSVELSASKNKTTSTRSSSIGKPSDNRIFQLEPLKFIAVGGPYHTGSTVSS